MFPNCYNSRSPAESDLRFDRVCRAPHRRYNSRSPAESDDDICEEDMRDIATTHALLRRATGEVPCPGIFVAATTPALLRRATIYILRRKEEKMLQLTLSCGERRLCVGILKVSTSLQLTLSCGERLCLPAFTACSLVATTHALLRRATSVLFPDMPSYQLQLTLSCGERPSTKYPTG